MSNNDDDDLFAWRGVPRTKTRDDTRERAFSPPAVAFSMSDAEELPLRLAGTAVLIVDDMPANADALRELLRLEGATVTIAVDAVRALEFVRRERFDVVISDLAMPGMSGREMMSAMRAAGPNIRTPAIAYSGYGDEEERRRAREAGFDLHLTKPATLDTFVDAILRLVSARPDAARPR